jgi:hypothetical protein
VRDAHGLINLSAMCAAGTEPSDTRFVWVQGVSCDGAW